MKDEIDIETRVNDLELKVKLLYAATLCLSIAVIISRCF